MPGRPRSTNDEGGRGEALAELARQEVPESVLRAYNLNHLEFGPDYLIPKPVDPRCSFGSHRPWRRRR